MHGLPIESTFEVTHLSARSFPATKHVMEEAAPSKRGDWPAALFSYWEDYKPIIRKLYIEEKRPLREVVEIMENEFDFKATYVCPFSCSTRALAASAGYKCDSTSQTEDV